MNIKILTANCICMLTLGASSLVHSALYDRGNGLLYDDALDITWLQDSNYAKTSGYDADGRITWLDAHDWTANLVYEGYDDWRLPSVLVPNGGYENTSELGHMFYNNLGHVFPGPTPLTNTSFIDAGSGNTVNILNMEMDHYWFAEESANLTHDRVFVMYVNPPYQGWSGQLPKLTSSAIPWAVRDGDVSAVPVPAAAWLFGSGLIGLIGVSRRQT